MPVQSLLSVRSGHTLRARGADGRHTGAKFPRTRVGHKTFKVANTTREQNQGGLDWKRHRRSRPRGRMQSQCCTSRSLAQGETEKAGRGMVLSQWCRAVQCRQAKRGKRCAWFAGWHLWVAGKSGEVWGWRQY